MLYELDTQCVEECPSGFMSVTVKGSERCIDCNGICPQGNDVITSVLSLYSSIECMGGIFDFQSSERPFSGCTIITTSLQIGVAPAE